MQAFFHSIVFLKKIGPSTASFCLFSLFWNTEVQNKTVDFSGIRTRIEGVEGENVDHLTTTTAQIFIPLFPLL